MRGTKHRGAAVAVALMVWMLGGAGAVGAQEPVAELTLEEAIERALRASPALAQAEGAVETAESGERVALGAFLPSISASSGASRSSTERFNPQTNTTVTGSSAAYSAGLSASMDVFTAGRRLAELKQSRAETTAREAALLEQRFGVVLAAKRAFFDALRTSELVRVAEARVQRAQEGLEAAERRLSVGSATRSDVLRAQLELTNARQALSEARNQERTARYELGRTVGADGPVAARDAGELGPEPLALTREELVALVVESSPAVRSAEAAVRASDAAVRVARTQYVPTVRASAGWDWFNQEAQLADGRKSWSMRLSLSYPIFNGFSREDALSRASVQSRVNRIALEDARRGARTELERVLAALTAAEERIALAEEAVKVAQEDLRVQEERYRLGAVTILERITSQENLVQAETDLVGARFDYQLARAELEALVGREL